jgi:MFS family permease
MALTTNVRPGSRSRWYFPLAAGICYVGIVTASFDSVARTVALPLIVRELHMSVGLAGLVFSASFAVTALSTLALGPISDRLGRRTAILLALLAAALTSGATAFVTQSWQYVLVGAAAGTTLTVIGASQVLVVEEAPPAIRGLSVGVLTTGFAVGSFVVGLIGALILPSGHWRLLFYVAFAPAVVGVVAYLILREPRRAAEALAIKRGQAVETVHQIDVERARQLEWRQIFAPDLRRCRAWPRRSPVPEDRSGRAGSTGTTSRSRSGRAWQTRAHSTSSASQGRPPRRPRSRSGSATATGDR